MVDQRVTPLLWLICPFGPYPEVSLCGTLSPEVNKPGGRPGLVQQEMMKKIVSHYQITLPG